MGFMEALVRVDRIDLGGMILAADAAHEAGDQPAIRQIVEHGELFGDRQGIGDNRQRSADDRNLDVHVTRAVDQGAGNDVRRRHQSVGGLMVLVDADAVEPDLRGKNKLIDIFLVEPWAFFGIVMGVRQEHPIGPVRIGLVEIEMPIRHQVEREELHRATS
jgi:hypothetical protein